MSIPMRSLIYQVNLENTFYSLCPNVVTIFVLKRVGYWVNVPERSSPVLTINVKHKNRLDSTTKIPQCGQAL